MCMIVCTSQIACKHIIKITLFLISQLFNLPVENRLSWTGDGSAAKTTAASFLLPQPLENAKLLQVSSSGGEKNSRT